MNNSCLSTHSARIWHLFWRLLTYDSLYTFSVDAFLWKDCMAFILSTDWIWVENRKMEVNIWSVNIGTVVLRILTQMFPITHESDISCGITGSKMTNNTWNCRWRSLGESSLALTFNWLEDETMKGCGLRRYKSYSCILRQCFCILGLSFPNGARCNEA